MERRMRKRDIRQRYRSPRAKVPEPICKSLSHGCRTFQSSKLGLAKPLWNFGTSGTRFSGTRFSGRGGPERLSDVVGRPAGTRGGEFLGAPPKQLAIPKVARRRERDLAERRQLFGDVLVEEGKEGR